MIICSSNMSGPNLFFFAAVAIPQSEKHRSDGVEAAGENNGRLMWTAEETAGSKDLRSVYGPRPGPDRPQTSLIAVVFPGIKPYTVLRRSVFFAVVLLSQLVSTFLCYDSLTLCYCNCCNFMHLLFLKNWDKDTFPPLWWDHFTFQKPVKKLYQYFYSWFSYSFLWFY